MYCDSVAIAILVYDVAQLPTFEALDERCSELVEKGSPNLSEAKSIWRKIEWSSKKQNGFRRSPSRQKL
jgi:hypothetical protein